MADNPRIEELRRRVQADPASIAFAALAEEFRRVGRYDEAVETCRIGLHRHPAYLSARVTLGRALIETGDFDAARQELETVLRSAPENLAASRGIAQIDERLGHSTEMDPHLAEMMKTMHAESIRAAALAPPPATLPAPPEPEPARTVPEPSPPPRHVEPQADPFAGFAPIAKQEPAHDFSADFAQAPSAIDTVVEAAPAAAALVTLEPTLEPRTEPAPEPVPEPAREPAQEPELEPERVLELEAAPAVGPVDGPDADVLAALARLERFLDGIQSLRA